jgi:hypothetical protein
MTKSFFVQLQASSDSNATLAISFEQLLAQLEKLPRMFVEWDGSFVWRGGGSGGSFSSSESGGNDDTWQLDGMVYDLQGAVRYVELKGCCLSQPWSEFMGALGCPTQVLVVHHVNEGRYESLDMFCATHIR